jgi:hypothetical protein
LNRSTTHRRALRGSATAACVALALSGGALALAPAALADGKPGDGIPKMSLSVDAPATIGFAGGPVEFTETLGNTGTSYVPDILNFDAAVGDGLPADGLSLDVKASDGSWQPVRLTLSKGVFSGQTIEGFSVPAGTTKTVHLRIGLPMGTPHHGDTNGGADTVTLTSDVVAAGSWLTQATDTHTIKVGSISSSFTGVPKSVTAGGAPAEFDAKVENPTPSAYTNLSHLLFADRNATVRVLRSGSWTTLTPVADPREPDGRLGFYLDGRDSSVGPDSSTTTRVRISYRAGTPAGPVHLGNCLVVNESSTPFTGTTLCEQDTVLTVEAAGAEPTPTASATATASPTPTASATPTATASATPTPATGTQLAETGSGGNSTVAAAAGGALLLAGLAAMASVRLRRRGR